MKIAVIGDLHIHMVNNMDIKEYITRTDQAVRSYSEIARKRLPYGKRKFVDASGRQHPGVLRDEAFKVKRIDSTHFDIYIDLNISPYAEYINRPGYKTNGYWERTVQFILEGVAKDLGGTLEEK